MYLTYTANMAIGHSMSGNFLRHQICCNYCSWTQTFGNIKGLCYLL